MKPNHLPPRWLFLVAAPLFLLVSIQAACRPGQATSPAPSQTATPYRMATRTPLPSAIPPTLMVPGNQAVYDDFQVSMLGYELGSTYTTEYGSLREPPTGQQFVWIHVQVANQGQTMQNLPPSVHYSVLYQGLEVKSSYGHRQNFSDYTTLRAGLSARQTVDGWLRYVLPIAAQAGDISFAYLPDSIQVSFVSPGTASPWAEHKIFLWRLK